MFFFAYRMCEVVNPMYSLLPMILEGFQMAPEKIQSGCFYPWMFQGAPFQTDFVDLGARVRFGK